MRARTPLGTPAGLRRARCLRGRAARLLLAHLLTPALPRRGPLRLAAALRPRTLPRRAVSRGLPSLRALLWLLYLALTLALRLHLLLARALLLHRLGIGPLPLRLHLRPTRLPLLRRLHARRLLWALLLRSLLLLGTLLLLRLLLLSPLLLLSLLSLLSLLALQPFLLLLRFGLLRLSGSRGQQDQDHRGQHPPHGRLPIRERAKLSHEGALGGKGASSLTGAAGWRTLDPEQEARMRGLIFGLLVWLAVAAPAAAMALPISAEQAVRAQAAAWSRGDLDAALAYYWDSPEITWISKAGVSRGFAEFAKGMRADFSDPAAMGAFEVSVLEARELTPDLALVVVDWRISKDGARRMGGVSTQLWRRFEGGWKIVLEHAS